MIATALTIAGSDPSGGAGVQADLKTFQRFGVFGTSVLTLLTVQNTQRVQRVVPVDPEIVLEQLEAVLTDIPPKAIKTGALGSAQLVESVAERLRAFLAERAVPLIVDPVLVSKHGDSLAHGDVVDAVRAHLLPLATLLTPNGHEAALLSGKPADSIEALEHAAAALHAAGARNVLAKGARIGEQMVDVLFTGEECHSLISDRIDSPNVHGTGCVLSASITAQLARGEPLLDAVQTAKAFVTAGIWSGPTLGQGPVQPIDFFADPYPRDH